MSGRRAKLLTLVLLLGVIGGMTGLTAAAVPLCVAPSQIPRCSITIVTGLIS